MTTLWLEFALFSVLAVTGVAIVMTRHLFAVVMLAGVYSLVSATLLVALDAVDVAFTEAAVGAGVSTVLMLGALALTTRREKIVTRSVAQPMILCVLTGAALIYGTRDFPPYGAPDNPIHGYLAPEFIRGSGEDFDIPNVVTSVLASYRGFDTLGETTVVFTAGIGVLLLVGRHHMGRRRQRKTPQGGGRA